MSPGSCRNITQSQFISIQNIVNLKVMWSDVRVVRHSN